MIIVNESKNIFISKDAKIMTSFADRCLGLLKSQNPRTLVFFTHFGIHTFGLETPIDILVLDNIHNVIKIGKEIKPNRFFFYNPIYRIIIELPRGTVNQTLTSLGDKIKIA